MRKDDKWVMFKNYMHNELGIGKDDIRGWIEEAVKEQALQMVQNTFKNYDMNLMMKDIIVSELKKGSWSNSVNKDIKEQVAKTLSENIILKLVD